MSGGPSARGNCPHEGFSRCWSCRLDDAYAEGYAACLRDVVAQVRADAARTDAVNDGALIVRDQFRRDVSNAFDALADRLEAGAARGAADKKE